MKKLLCLLVALLMVISMTACGSKDSGAADTEEPAADETATAELSELEQRVMAARDASEGKIAIITNTLSQNEEEFRSADFMVEKYGADRITHDVMPDNFMTEQEQFVAVVSKYGADPEYKAIIINQACPGSNAAIDKVLESREKDDLLIAYCTPQENADDIVKRADIILSIDEINKGTAIAQQEDIRSLQLPTSHGTGSSRRLP